MTIPDPPDLVEPAEAVEAKASLLRWWNADHSTRATDTEVTKARTETPEQHDTHRSRIAVRPPDRKIHGQQASQPQNQRRFFLRGEVFPTPARRFGD